jgi:tetratricopeptide (TPR) repeat protein
MRALIAVALLAAAPPARAQDDAPHAKALYQAATRLYNVGDFRQALEKFKGAYLAKPDPSFLFNMGQCYRQLADPESAARQYRAYLRESPAAPNRAEVLRFIDDAEAEIARRAAQKPPTGVMPVEKPPAQEEAPPREEPLVAAAPPPKEEPRSRRGLWIGLGVGAAAVVVAALVIGLAVGLSGPAAPPGSTLGDYRVLP